MAVAVRQIAASLAIAASLCAASSAHAQEPAREGHHGVGHEKLHHWYRTLRQPGTGYECCDQKDCRPTTARIRGADVEVLVDGEWTKVPPAIILKGQSPDMNTHVCAPRGPWSPKPIFCVVLGFGV